MAILNLTPDSYYAPSRATSVDGAVARALELVGEGADWLDVGGESTRPTQYYGGMAQVSVEEELGRVVPVLEQLAGLPVSIDTTKAQVAAEAVRLGAHCINDISGLSDPGMVDLLVGSGVKYCLCHCPNPLNELHREVSYEAGIVEGVYGWLAQRIEQLMTAGVRESQIWVDPGIGFGKTVSDQWELVANLYRFKSLGFPLLVGLSRKSFLGKTFGKRPEELLPETLALAKVALAQQVDILRVHDVKAHRTIAPNPC